MPSTRLYRVIDEHLEAFLETARRNADGSPLPEFVEQEFRDFLTCGVLAHGFARLRCTDCHRNVTDKSPKRNARDFKLLHKVREVG